MKRVLTGLFFTLASTAAYAAESASADKPGTKMENSAPAAPRRMPATLMFTTDELNDIQGRIATGGQDDSGARGGDNSKVENATLYLSTILYTSPTDWTIWLNGKPIGPHHEFEDISVTDIGPRYVELLVPLSAQGMSPVRLSPNQTFIAKSGIIVEGRQ